MELLDSSREGRDTVKVMFAFRSRGVWCIQKPADEAWLELFDSDVLPTVFRAETPAAEVVAELRLSNPDYDVIAVNDE